ncbi:MAG: thymidine kinase [Clostridiales bacterium]|nr:thymidine kinase [Clostridiales bacterium]
MAKLYFRYGAMNSGKTANLLMVAHNYINQGKNVIIIKPDKDTRWGIKIEVKSRAIVTSLPAALISDSEDLFAFTQARVSEKPVEAILVEEAQFLTKDQVRQLAVVVDKLNIPVLCYGLRCSYIDGELFDGSAALMYWADTIEEVKNVCQYCSSKATKNLLRVNGVPQYSGDNVVMGDVDMEGSSIYYTPVCRRHYLNPPAED